MTTRIDKVAVLGTGVFGSQIAYQTAYSGFDVTAHDISDEILEKARNGFAGLAARYEQEVEGASALPALTKNLALELAPIRVNVIAAGFVDTPLSATLLGDQLDARREQLRNTLPIGRVVEPADVAALAIHLMTNSTLTGATFDIDGGQQLVGI